MPCPYLRAWRLGGAVWLVAVLGLVAGPASAGEAGSIQVEPDIQHLWSGEAVEFTVRVSDSDDASRAAAVLRWEFALSGAVLAEGEKELALAPGAAGRVTVKFEAPQVRHASDVAGRLALLRGDDARARHEIVLRVYPAWDPQPVLRLLEHKRIGVADPSGRIQRLLADSGLTAKALTVAPEVLSTAAAVRAFCGDALILGPGVGEAPNLAGSALEAAAAGQTVLWLEPGDTSSWREPFGLPQAWSAEPVPPLVLAPEHPALSGIEPADLAPWRGEGGPGFIMGTPEGGNFRGLVAVAGEKPGYSLLELFPGASSRIVLCQLPVVSRFGAEPVARMLFELLLKYGLSDVPRFSPATLWAAPDSALRLLAEKAGLALAEDRAPGEGLFVIAVSARMWQPVGAQHAAPLPADKIRAHLEAGGKCLFVGAEPGSGVFLERCGVRDLAFKPAPEKPEWSVEPVPLTWGISPQDIAAAARALAPIASAAGAGEQTPVFQYQVIAAGAMKTAAAPGVIVKAPVGPGEAILCQLALDRAPEDPTVIALFRQLLTNLGARLERKDQK